MNLYDFISLFRKPDILSYNILGVNDNETISQDALSSSLAFINSIDSEILIDDSELARVYIDEKLRIEFVGKIMNKIKILNKLGNDNLIYKSQFHLSKKKLVEMLARMFGTHEMMGHLEDVVEELERINFFPNKSKKKFIMLTPMSRWYG